MAVEHIQSVACHPEHMLYFELDSIVAVDIVLGEEWDSTVQVLAVGTSLVVVEGKAVVGEVVEVNVAQRVAAAQGEVVDKVHSLAVKAPMDKVVAVHMVLEAAGLLVNKVVEDQLMQETNNRLINPLSADIKMYILLTVL